MISDVGDGTFAVLLHGDLHVGRGDVTFLAVLLPGSGPAVTFVLLDDVQHLWRRALASLALLLTLASSCLWIAAVNSS